MFRNKPGTTTMFDNWTLKKMFLGGAILYLGYRATKTAI